MSDIHALSGAYAVDALDDIERAQFERHLRDCDICNHEVESLREASALLAETSAVAPSSELRAKVLAEIATVRPLPPVAEPAEARPSGRGRRFPALVAAAAAVVALVAGGVAWQVIDDPDSATDQVLQADDAERFTQTFPGGATATVVRSQDLNQAVLITEDMPPAPDGHSYALWLQHDADMVPAGIMPSGADNQVLLSGDAATADGAGITVETEGELHDEPEGEVVALFEFGA
jgi:anti-sigma-K factor RskA